MALKYERGEVHHLAGAGLEQLEDELVLFTDDGQPIDPSPDRADACIWSLTDLLEGRRSRISVVGGPVILGGTEKSPTVTPSRQGTRWPTAWPPSYHVVTSRDRYLY